MKEHLYNYRHTIKSRLIAILLSCALFGTSLCVPPAQALTAPPLVLATDAGRVCEEYTAPSLKKVIFIQNAHANASAQESIEKILSDLQRQHVSSLYVEGSCGPVDVSLFRAYPLKDTMKSLIAEEVRSGRITGAEQFAICSEKPVAVWGVEDEAAYIKHVEVCARLMAGQDAIAEKLEEIRAVIFAKINALSDKELQSFYSERMNEKERSLLEMTQRIFLLSKRFSVPLDAWKSLKELEKIERYQTNLNNGTLEKERTRLHTTLVTNAGIRPQDLERLAYLDIDYKAQRISDYAYYAALRSYAMQYKIPRAQYEHITLYVYYLWLMTHIDAQSIERACHEAEVSIGKHISSTDELREINTLVSHYGLVKRLLTLRATPDDIRDYRSLGSLHSLFQDTIMVSYAEEFYRLASEREQALVMHTLENMHKKGESVAVLVAGGYHTRGVMEELRKKKVSYMVVTPRLGEEAGATPYESIMASYAPYFGVEEGTRGGTVELFSAIQSLPSLKNNAEVQSLRDRLLPRFVEELLKHPERDTLVAAWNRYNTEFVIAQGKNPHELFMMHEGELVDALRNQDIPTLMKLVNQSVLGRLVSRIPEKQVSVIAYDRAQLQNERVQIAYRMLFHGATEQWNVSALITHAVTPIVLQLQKYVEKKVSEYKVSPEKLTRYKQSVEYQLYMKAQAFMNNFVKGTEAQPGYQRLAASQRDNPLSHDEWAKKLSATFTRIWHFYEGWKETYQTTLQRYFLYDEQQTEWKFSQERKKDIHDSLKRLDTIICFLLDRFTRGSLLKEEPVNVADCVRGMTIQNNFDHQDQGREPLKVHISGNAMLKNTDRTGVQICLERFVSNVARMGVTDVYVTIAEKNGRCQIVIEDNGKGLSPLLLKMQQGSDRQDVFCLGTTTRARRTGGTGMVLSWHIAKLLGGDITADNGSHYGGARFTVSLPLGETVQLKPESAPESVHAPIVVPEKIRSIKEFEKAVSLLVQIPDKVLQERTFISCVEAIDAKVWNAIAGDAVLSRKYLSLCASLVNDNSNRYVNQDMFDHDRYPKYRYFLLLFNTVQTYSILIRSQSEQKPNDHQIMLQHAYYNELIRIHGPLKDALTQHIFVVLEQRVAVAANLAQFPQYWERADATARLKEVLTQLASSHIVTNMKSKAQQYKLNALWDNMMMKLEYAYLSATLHGIIAPADVPLKELCAVIQEKNGNNVILLSLLCALQPNESFGKSVFQNAIAPAFTNIVLADIHEAISGFKSLAAYAQVPVNVFDGLVMRIVQWCSGGADTNSARVVSFIAEYKGWNGQKPDAKMTQIEKNLYQMYLYERALESKDHGNEDAAVALFVKCAILNTTLSVTLKALVQLGLVTPEEKKMTGYVRYLLAVLSFIESQNIDRTTALSVLGTVQEWYRYGNTAQGVRGLFIDVMKQSYGKKRLSTEEDRIKAMLFMALYNESLLRYLQPGNSILGKVKMSTPCLLDYFDKKAALPRVTIVDTPSELAQACVLAARYVPLHEKNAALYAEVVQSLVDKDSPLYLHAQLIPIANMLSQAREKNEYEVVLLLLAEVPDTQDPDVHFLKKKVEGIAGYHCGMMKEATIALKHATELIEKNPRGTINDYLDIAYYRALCALEKGPQGKGEAIVYVGKGLAALLEYYGHAIPAQSKSDIQMLQKALSEVTMDEYYTERGAQFLELIEAVSQKSSAQSAASSRTKAEVLLDDDLDSVELLSQWDDELKAVRSGEELVHSLEEIQSEVRTLCQRITRDDVIKDVRSYYDFIETLAPMNDTALDNKKVQALLQGVFRDENPLIGFYYLQTIRTMVSKFNSRLRVQIEDQLYEWLIHAHAVSPQSEEQQEVVDYIERAWLFLVELRTGIHIAIRKESISIDITSEWKKKSLPDSLLRNLLVWYEDKNVEIETSGGFTKMHASLHEQIERVVSALEEKPAAPTAGSILTSNNGSSLVTEVLVPFAIASIVTGIVYVMVCGTYADSSVLIKKILPFLVMISTMIFATRYMHDRPEEALVVDGAERGWGLRSDKRKTEHIYFAKKVKAKKGRPNGNKRGDKTALFVAAKQADKLTDTFDRITLSLDLLKGGDFNEFLAGRIDSLRTRYVASESSIYGHVPDIAQELVLSMFTGLTKETQKTVIQERVSFFIGLVVHERNTEFRDKVLLRIIAYMQTILIGDGKSLPDEMDAFTVKVLGEVMYQWISVHGTVTKQTNPEVARVFSQVTSFMAIAYKINGEYIKRKIKGQDLDDPEGSQRAQEYVDEMKQAISLYTFAVTLLPDEPEKYPVIKLCERIAECYSRLVEHAIKLKRFEDAWKYCSQLIQAPHFDDFKDKLLHIALYSSILYWEGRTDDDRKGDAENTVYETKTKRTLEFAERLFSKTEAVQVLKNVDPEILSDEYLNFLVDAILFNPEADFEVRVRFAIALDRAQLATKLEYRIEPSIALIYKNIADGHFDAAKQLSELLALVAPRNREISRAKGVIQRLEPLFIKAKYYKESDNTGELLKVCRSIHQICMEKKIAERISDLRAAIERSIQELEEIVEETDKKKDHIVSVQKVSSPTTIGQMLNNGDQHRDQFTKKERKDFTANITKAEEDLKTLKEADMKEELGNGKMLEGVVALLASLKSSWREMKKSECLEKLSEINTRIRSCREEARLSRKIKKEQAEEALKAQEPAQTGNEQQGSQKEQVVAQDPLSVAVRLPNVNSTVSPKKGEDVFNDLTGQIALLQTLINANKEYPVTKVASTDNANKTCIGVVAAKMGDEGTLSIWDQKKSQMINVPVKVTGEGQYGFMTLTAKNGSVFPDQLKTYTTVTLAIENNTSVQELQVQQLTDILTALKKNNKQSTGNQLLDAVLGLTVLNEPLTYDDLKGQLPYDDWSCDMFQRAAIHMMDRTSLGVIHGPFGTGKTKTIEQGIRHFVLKEKRPVLMFSQQHKTVDDITGKASGLEDVPVLRLGNAIDRMNTVGKQYSVKEENARHAFNAKYAALNKEEGEKGCLLSATVTGSALDHYIKELQKMGNSHQWENGVMIVDEAAVLDYPSLLTAISIFKPAKLFLVGDHEQFKVYPLSAQYDSAVMTQINSKVKNRFEKSIFLDLIQNSAILCVTLAQIYRCHRVFVDLVRFFYGGKKLYSKSELENDPIYLDTLEIVDDSTMAGYQEAEVTIDGGKTFENQEEARWILEKAKTFLGKIGNPTTVYTANDISIITPYRGQVECIKKLIMNDPMFTDEEREIFMSHCLTSREAHGYENKVILLSLVRSTIVDEKKPQMMFTRTMPQKQTQSYIVADPALLLVSLTRAREKMAVIGNRRSLVSMCTKGNSIAKMMYHKLFDFKIPTSYEEPTEESDGTSVQHPTAGEIITSQKGFSVVELLRIATLVMVSLVVGYGVYVYSSQIPPHAFVDVLLCVACYSLLYYITNKVMAHVTNIKEAWKYIIPYIVLMCMLLMTGVAFADYVAPIGHCIRMGVAGMITRNLYLQHAILMGFFGMIVYAFYEYATTKKVYMRMPQSNELRFLVSGLHVLDVLFVCGWLIVSIVGQELKWVQGKNEIVSIIIVVYLCAIWRSFMSGIIQSLQETILQSLRNPHMLVGTYALSEEWAQVLKDRKGRLDAKDYLRLRPVAFSMTFLGDFVFYLSEPHVSRVLFPIFYWYTRVITPLEKWESVKNKWKDLNASIKNYFAPAQQVKVPVSYGRYHRLPSETAAVPVVLRPQDSANIRFQDTLLFRVLLSALDKEDAMWRKDSMAALIESACIKPENVPYVTSILQAYARNPRMHSVKKLEKNYSCAVAFDSSFITDIEEGRISHEDDAAVKGLFMYDKVYVYSERRLNSAEERALKTKVSSVLGIEISSIECAIKTRNGLHNDFSFLTPANRSYDRVIIFKSRSGSAFDAAVTHALEQTLTNQVRVVAGQSLWSYSEMGYVVQRIKTLYTKGSTPQHRVLSEEARTLLGVYHVSHRELGLLSRCVDVSQQTGVFDASFADTMKQNIEALAKLKLLEQAA